MKIIHFYSAIIILLTIIGIVSSEAPDDIIRMSVTPRALPTYNYAYQTIQGATERLKINAITQDSTLRNIVCGNIYDDLNVDGTILLSYPSGLSKGYDPIAVVGQITSTGTWNWFIMINATGGSECNDITIDNGDNVYIAGSMTGSASFPPSTTVSFSDPGSLAFVAKIDKNGNTKWVTTTRNTAGHGASFKAIDIDGSKNLYVTGSFNQQVTVSGTSYSAPNTLLRVLNVKLNGGGAVQWSNIDSSTAVPWNYPLSEGIDISYVSSSMLIVTGNYRTGPSTFGTFTLPVDQQYWMRFFVIVINAASGAFINAVYSYDAGWSYDVVYVNSMTVSNGYIYLTGNYRGTLGLNSALTSSLTLNSGTSLMPWPGFLAVYTTSLTPVAISSINSDFAFPFSICPSSSSKIAVCGSFSGTMTPSSISTSSLAVPFTLIYDVTTPSSPTYYSSIAPSFSIYIPYKYGCYCDGSNNVFSAFAFDHSGTFGSYSLSSSSSDVGVTSASF